MVFKRRNTLPRLVRLRHFFYPRSGWRRAIEYISHRVRRIPDTPHRISLGLSCGVFVSFSPLFGLHFFYAVALARLLRGNVVAALIGTFFGNPVTFPIIASLSLTLGRLILGAGASGRDPNRILEAFQNAAAGLWEAVVAHVLHGTADWDKLAAFFRDILLPYFVGGLLPGLVCSIGAYYGTRSLIAAYQAARRLRLARRAALRRKGKADGPA